MRKASKAGENMKRILITGSTGFVGSNLLRKLVADGSDEIHIFIRRTSNIWRIQDIIGKINMHFVDLKERKLVQEEISKIRPDWIFHCATYGAYPSQKDNVEITTTDFVGTVNLLDACTEQGFGAFINVGSSSEYGMKNKEMSELDFPDPINTYGVAKLASTYYCRMSSIRYQLPIVTLRIFSAYGYYEEPGRLIPYLITSMLTDRRIKLASPNAVRDYVFIEDIVDAFILAAESAGKLDLGTVLNVGSGTDSKVIDVFNILSQMTGYSQEPEITGTPRDSDAAQVWRADKNKIENILGWKAKNDLVTGLTKTVEWFRRNLSLYIGGE